MGMERGTGAMGAGCADFIRDRFGYRRCRAFSSVVWVVALLCLGHPVQRVAAAEWSQFRGWNSSGVMETSSLPVRFGPHRNLVWRASTAPGRSSPILTREHIFLSAVEGEQLWVICLDRSSGDLQWRREVPRPRSEVMHRANGPASPTPVTDGSNVYAFFSEFGLISFDQEGRERWRLPMGPFNNPMGLAASPILADGKVLMICDQESGSFFVAVDQMTGQVLWRVERPGFTRGFSTPVLYRPEGGRAAGSGPGVPSIDGLLGGDR
jgi:outer membrane protein assembly factor BamB